MIERLTKSLLPGEVPIHEVNIRFANHLDEVLEFKEWLSKPRNVLAIDTETTGLNTYEDDARIRLVQFGDENEAWVINAERWAGVAQDVIETYDGPMVWHNVQYDYAYIRQVWPEVKFQWDKTHDTMIYHRIHDNENSAELKVIGKRLWGPVASVGQDLLNQAFNENGWTWKTVPMDVPAYSMYSGMDVILTARLFMRLAHVHSGPYKHIAELEMQTARICADMSITGIDVDREYCQEHMDRLSGYVKETKDILQSHYGVNIGSPQQLVKFFTDQGAVLTERTDKGALKTDKDVMEHLAANGFTIAKTILDVRKADKLATSFFSNLLDFSANPTGKLHAQINTMEARTGRMSIRKPALQTLPSNDSLVRSALIAPKGHKIISCDFSQIEMRLTAHLSGDPALIAAFKDCDATGEDFFTRVGKDIYGPAFVKADPRRTLIKNVMYGSTYGAGIPKMADSAGVPLHVMQPVAEALFHKFVGIKGIQTMATNEARSNLAAEGRPYIMTAAGSRLFVDEESIYAAANYKVQGFAAICMKKAIIALFNAGLGEFMRLPVHDEIILVVPDELVDEVMAIVGANMTITEAMGFAVGIPAEPEGPFERWKGKA